MGMFLEYDAQTIHDSIISRLQEATGEVLPEGDERRVFAEAMTAYMLAVLSTVEDVAKQKMLRYARGEVLDALGEMYGCERIGAEAASCTLRFTIPEAVAYAVTVPAGTIASTPDGLAFSTDADATIAAGETSVDVAGTAADVGSEYNGLVTGSVNVIRSALPFPATVANIGTTDGGTDGEPDDDEGNELFRQRILLAQNAVNTAGTKSSYIAIAKAADADIADVQVPDLDEAYRVLIYVVKSGGELFDADEIAGIQAACDADDVRPLGDLVEVRNASRVAYSVDVSYTCAAADEAAVVAAVEGSGGAIDAYLEWQDETIGRGIQPQKLMALVFAAGAETVTVSSPSAAEVGVGCVAKCSSVAVSHEAV
ncbi:MAG: baseplate J/gp47 family protein [Eggerthellaceae bacterium]|nr:baseplate J/gp47 family protein [Eggerthellaceae bacterium]